MTAEAACPKLAVMDAAFLLRNPSTSQKRGIKIELSRTALRSTWRARNSFESVGASHCSFAALAHN
jgi:hypothetical protein